MQVPGGRLYYQSSGSGPAIVLLHGFTLDLEMWQPQIAALEQNLRVVRYDARGFGRSSLPGVESYRHCDDAAQVIEALGLAPAIVVGHSIGAHQLLELSLTRPEQVRGWASVCMSGLAGVPFTAELLALFGAVRSHAREQGVPSALRLWLEGEWFAPARERPDVRQQLDAIVERFTGWHWLNDNPATNPIPPAASRLSALHVPALHIAGKRDTAYNHALTLALAAGIPQLELVELDVGHMANLEDAAAVNAALLAFARRCLG